MSSEEAWAKQKEWENERGELEINFVKPADANEMCCALKCKLPARIMYEVVECGKKFSAIEINLCAEHDSEEAAFDLYRKYHDGV